MNRTYEFLRDDRVTGDPLPAAELNALVRILDRQVHGALQGISDGVVTGGVVAAGSGLSVTVTALQAILASTNGYTYLQTDSTLTVSSLPINETVYIWASAIWSDGPGEEDSRETAQVLLEWSYSDDLADAVLLAEVTTGGASVSTVTDQRTFIPLQDLVLRVAALETAAVSVEEDLADIEEDLGTGYWVDGEPVPGEISIHERLEDLEMGGGGGGGGTVYWGSLAKTSGDITSIEEYVAGQVGSGGGGGGGGGHWRHHRGPDAQRHRDQQPPARGAALDPRPA